jgi:hypothetical protein
MQFSAKIISEEVNLEYQLSRDQLLLRTPAIRETRKRIIKMIKRIQAISDAIPAIPPRPKRPAMIAIIKNTRA